MNCRRCGTPLSNGKCPNCSILRNSNNKTKPKKKNKKKKWKVFIFLFLIILITGFIGITYYKFTNNQMAEKQKSKIQATTNELLEILKSEQVIENGEIITDKVLDVPVKETPPKIDLSFSEVNIDVALDGKNKSIFAINNKILNETIEVNAQLLELENGDGLVLTGTIKNITTGFDFPKLNIRTLSYNTNLANKSVLKHSDNFLIEDTYILALKEGETKKFTMKIRDKNTKYVKIGINTGTLFLHSDENAISVNNDISIPVITTPNYKEESSYLPYKYSIVNKDGEVSKIYENKKILKSYDATEIPNPKKEQ